MSTVTLKLSTSNLTIFNAYRPPPTTTKSREPVPFSDFLTDTFLSLAATILLASFSSLAISIFILMILLILKLNNFLLHPTLLMSHNIYSSG